MIFPFYSVLEISAGPFAIVDNVNWYDFIYNEIDKGKDMAYNNRLSLSILVKIRNHQY